MIVAQWCECTQYDRSVYLRMVKVVKFMYIFSAIKRSPSYNFPTKAGLPLPPPTPFTFSCFTLSPFKNFVVVAAAIVTVLNNLRLGKSVQMKLSYSGGGYDKML